VENLTPLPPPTATRHCKLSWPNTQSLRGTEGDGLRSPEEPRAAAGVRQEHPAQDRVPRVEGRLRRERGHSVSHGLSHGRAHSHSQWV